jgi:AraC-like DNA-binding protein
MSQLPVEALPASGPIASSLVWLAAALALLVLVLVVLRHRGERRRNQALMARLDELEARLAAHAAAPAEDAAAPYRETEAERATPNPSADVLAGRTSLVRGALEGGGSGVRTLAEQAIACIHGQLGERLAPHELAARLHVSLRTLERGLDHALDCAPRQLITAMKMREAHRMLRSGRYRVKEVAYRLGFADQYHFSRCFKEFYHLPPSAVVPSHDRDRGGDVRSRQRDR